MVLSSGKILVLKDIGTDANKEYNKVGYIEIWIYLN